MFIYKIAIFLVLVRYLVAKEGCVEIKEERCDQFDGCDSPICRWCNFETAGNIPEDLPKYLSELKIVSNVPLKLTNTSFANCFNLSMLDLSRTSLSELPVNIFRDTQKLSVLYLNNNQLGTNGLNNDVFKPFKKVLRELYLSYNADFSSMILSDMDALERLSIDVRLLTNEFPSLKSLVCLSVTDYVERITSSTFARFKNLKYLRLLNITTSSIEKEAFSSLKYLVFLLFQKIRFFSLAQITDTLEFATDTIEVLQLSHIVGFHISSTQLPNSFSQHLKKMTNLQTLKLDRNYITDLGTNFTDSIPEVNYLDLNSNRFPNVYAAIFNFYRLRKLSNLYVSHQLMFYIIEDDDSVDFMDGCEEFTVKTPKQNSKKIKSGVLIGEWEDLCFARPRIKCISPFSYASSEQFSKAWCIFSPKKLQKLHLNQGFNNNQLTPILIFGRNDVNYFNFSNNEIYYLNGPIIIDKPVANQSVIFDFSSNGVECLSPNLLHQSIRNGLQIGTLILKNNRLMQQLEDDEEGLAFKYYESLHTLDLSNNGFIYLPNKIFISLKNLVNLYLTDNFLQVITFEIGHFKSLKLDLNNRRINCYDCK